MQETSGEKTMVDRDAAVEIAKICMSLCAKEISGHEQTEPNLEVSIGGTAICKTGGMGEIDARLAVADALYQCGFRHGMDGDTARRMWPGRR